MAVGVLRFGIFIFVVGFFSYFSTHSNVISSLICSVGFALFVIGTVFWSLETTGEISLS